ncbi:MAG TPA: cyclic nucleotide-binding domain-containing protein, partial [Ramlibacter sp.]|nr:cyclic nucleotide-binding domain-containing protein [Ramlibacter sp.]
MYDQAIGVLQDLARPLMTGRGALLAILSAIGLGFALAGSFVRTMVPLRALTLASSVFLLASAALAFNLGAVLLFLLLVPLNAWRLVEIVRLTRRVSAAAAGDDLSGLWLKPYMKRRVLPAGTIVFRRGDLADALFLLVNGKLQWEEIGTHQAAGQLFGEISFFSPDGRRTLTGR